MSDMHEKLRAALASDNWKEEVAEIYFDAVKLTGVKADFAHILPAVRIARAAHAIGVAEERERCVKIADHAFGCPDERNEDDTWENAADTIRRRIRSAPPPASATEDAR